LSPFSSDTEVVENARTTRPRRTDDIIAVDTRLGFAERRTFRAAAISSD